MQKSTGLWLVAGALALFFIARAANRFKVSTGRVLDMQQP